MVILATKQQHIYITMESTHTVTIRYGLTNSITRSFSPDTRVSDILSDTGVLAALSAPESVSAVSNGQTLNRDAYINNYDTITLEQQASSKA